MRDICVTLMERYEVDEDTCLAEVQRFADELLDAGLAQRQRDTLRGSRSVRTRIS